MLFPIAMRNRRRDSPGSASRSAQDLLGHGPGPPVPASERFPWRYALIFITGAALVVAGMWYHIDSQRRTIRANWRGQIESIANDRGQLVESWLETRQGDAEVLATSPPVRALFTGSHRGEDRRGGDDAATALNRVAAAYGYAGIVIFDAGGHVLARSAGASAPEATEGDLALEVVQTRRLQTELIDDPRGPRRLTVAVPLFSEVGVGTSRVLGVISLRLRPEAGLFRLLTGETAPRTDETLLFRLYPRRPAYLTPLRDQPAGWAALNRSLEGLSDLAMRAQPGRSAFGEVTDYRSVPVFVAVRPIRAAGWALALKVDRDEIMAEVNRTSQLAGAAGAFLLLALAGFLVAFWRQQQRTRLLKAQMDQDRAISNLKGYAEKIVASMPSGLLLLSADLVILSVNPSFLESFRLREDEVVGQNLADVFGGEILIRRAREVLRNGTPQRDVLFDLFVRPRHETHPVLGTMTGIRMVGNAPGRLLLIVQDLSEEERLQAARRASEERFRDLVQGLDAIVWEADAATLRFSFVSQRAENILGYPVARWLGTADFFITRIHPDDRARAMEVCNAAVAELVDHEFEYRAITADGREIWLRDIVHVVPKAVGRPVQLRGLTVDLTERKRAEEALHQTADQLRQVQKMDAVGKLAGGIAHDFNNLLMIIRGEADLILRRLAPGDVLAEYAEGIREASDQAAALTRQLLAFSRKQVLAPSMLDLNTVVTGVQKMLRRLIGETIDLVTTTSSDLGMVRADAGQLEQTIINLAVNARDAMPDGGRLTISTSNAEVDEATARQRGVNAGAYVMLEVTDTGVGMDLETQAHLFEPFFTTKEHGKGTGLGLSTVYGIVNQSGGHIWVDSAPGKGTSFRVYLPQVAAEAATPTPPSVEVPAEVGAQPTTRPRRLREATVGAPKRETVLLVEDARRVREVVREILETNGYEVLAAQRGDEAVGISDHRVGPIQLMVTDVVMPEMSGRELAQRLAPVRPDMRVLYMSGYTDDAIVKHGVLDAGIAFISKPFTPDALLAKVRAVLDAPARNGVEEDADLVAGPERARRLRTHA